MNRREHNRHAQTPAEAARDRVLERRQRLTRITGATPAEGLELEPALEAIARLSRALGPELDRVLEVTSRLGISYQRAIREMSASAGRFAELEAERSRERRRLLEESTARLDAFLAAQRGRR